MQNWCIIDALTHKITFSFPNKDLIINEKLCFHLYYEELLNLILREY